MTVHLRRAVSSEAKPLVGLYAESGGGKTHSALLLASGFVGGDMAKVAMIETESGRGEAWADDPVVGGYQVISLREEFSPSTYGGAIAMAEREGVRALIIDSASHEWEGVGGVLSMAADNEKDGKKGVLVWQQPKILHAREFMLRLQQTPIALVIVCMRAKYAMEQVTAKTLESWDRPGKPPKVGDWIRSSDLSPKQSDDILFEMFVHGWVDKDAHRFHGTKYTIPVMREILIDGEAISVDTGRRLAAWAAKGGAEADAARTGAALAAANRMAITGSPVALPHVDEALLIKAREFAECGTARYAEWWGQLTPEQRKAIGAERHESFKAIAAQVPT